MDNVKKVTKADIAVWIIVALVFYFFLCIVSWVIAKIAGEWGFVVAYDTGEYFPTDKPNSDIGKNIALFYNLTHYPRILYLYFLTTYQMTTLAITGILGLVIWGMLKSDD